MATREEVNEAITAFAIAVKESMAAHYLIDSDEQDLIKARQNKQAARARLLALLAPEPEPSDAEVEDDEVDAAGEAIWASIIGPRSNVPWDRQPRDMQARYRIAGRSALAAARAARQTGGA